MLETLLAAVMMLACLSLIQLIKKPEIQAGLMTFDHTDIIKGVSIFLIIIFHIGAKSGISNLSPLSLASLVAFLVCSGFGLQSSYEKNGLKGFFRKKLIRILIPYWIVMAVHFALNPSEFSLLSLAEALILVKTYAYWWFVQCIVISYIVFFLIYKLLPGKFRLPCFLLLAAVLFFVLRDDLYPALSFSVPAGIMLSKYGSKAALSNKKALFISLAAIVLSAGLTAVKLLPSIHTSGYPTYSVFQLLIGMLLATAIIGLTYALKKLFIIKMFAFAGRASYELYLVHTLLIFMIVDRATPLNVALYVAVFGAAAVAFYFLNGLISRRLSGKRSKLRQGTPS
jgi:peptidoglycan/LPS O-acetylase OafA/YrhL